MMQRAIIKKWHLLSGDYGFIICFLLSIIVLVCFFGNVLLNANNVYFGNTGDAMQTYYNSIYHVLYDQSYVYQQAMNYPYQESVFFTACHPVITSLAKVFGLGDYTVGIVNLTVLFLLPAGAWCLYFVFKHLGVNSVFAAVAAVAIAFLSPQVARLNSHCTLSYCFAIPAIIYLALRFYNSPDFKKSFLIAALVFFMASTHMYFLVFYALILTWVWITYFYTRGFKNSWKLFLKHYSIQVILPFLLIQVMVFLLNEYNDRTKNPVGFMENTSSWSGVFYPFGRFYEDFFKFSGLQNIPAAWEGIAYIGIAACFISVLLIIGLLYRVATLRYKKLFSFTSSPFLNGLILCALFSLFYSFGWPFVFGHEDWVDKIGFFKQIRALGRFTWIFYYIINIALIVMVSEIPEKYNRYKLKSVLASIVLTALVYDAYVNIRSCGKDLYNTLPELSDKHNNLPQNNWAKKIKASEFQAIFPFPWFHVGSENFYFPPENGMDLNTYMVSLKTGIPIAAVMGSRVSLEQTYSNLELLREPTGRLPGLLKKFNSKNDILLLVLKDSLKSDYEKIITQKSTFIGESDKFSVRRLTFDSLCNYYTKHADNKIKEYKRKSVYTRGNYQATDSTHSYVVNNFSDDIKTDGFITPGVLSGIPKNYFCIFNDSLKQLTQDSVFTFSFWMNHIREDQQIHQVIAIEATNNGNVYNALYSSAELHLKQLDGNWGLVECTFKLRKSTDRIRVVLWNPKFDEKRTDSIDDVLFKPAKVDVYRLFPKFMLINNCIYYYD